MILTQMIAAGGVLCAGSIAYIKKPKKKQLFEVIQPKNKVAVRSEPALLTSFDNAAKSLEIYLAKKTAVWFGDTRQQQLAEMTSAEVDAEISEAEKQANRVFALSVASLGLAAAGAVIYWPLALLSAPGMVYAGIPIHKKSIKELTEGKVSVHTLVTVVTGGCLVFGYFVVGNLTAVFYWISRKLTIKVKDQSKHSLVDVFRQQSQTVWLVTDGMEVEVPFEKLKPGDVVVVNAGEVIPVDGKVTEGIASVDQHILTGESQPVEKEVGDSVFASTALLSGKLFIEVEHAGEETTAAKIGRILNNTEDFKSDLQMRAEMLADKTVLPTLITSALALPFLGPNGALAISSAHFKYKMSVISPISILNHINIMSQDGVLVKDGRVLDLLNQVDTIVFDKTGTLTQEQPHVETIYTYGEYDENTLLAYAAGAEYKQKHPIAKAIIEEATQRGLDIPTIQEGEYKIGYGLTVTINGHLVRVGSGRFMEISGILIPQSIQEGWHGSHDQGHSLIMVAIDEQLVGAIEVVPTIRPEAKAVIHQLRQLPHIKSLYIISGDHEAPTKKLAQELGVDFYFAETLPENKADIIEQLQAEGNYVCYIGDGINDSIALKKSHVAISLRGASTVATDTAQIILMDESLKKLPDIFNIAHDFDSNIKQGFIVLLIPTFIGIGGIFLFNFGLVHTLILSQVATVAGVSSSMLPLLTNSKNKNGNNKKLISLPWKKQSFLKNNQSQKQLALN